MRTIIICLLVTFSLSSYSQKKKVVLPVKDTTKQEQYYYIAGRIDDFKLLFIAVDSPGDVTPNQKRLVLEWINKLNPIKVDTTKKLK